MAPIIADTFRVAINWVGPSPAIAENVIHIICATGDSTDVAGGVIASFNANMWQMVSDSYVIDSLDVTPLDGSDLTTHFAVPVSGTARGQATGDYIPNACALVKHTTATGGRKGRGRTYLPALAESRQTNGVTAAAQRALTTTGWLTFENSLFTNTPAMVLAIASYTNSSSAIVIDSVCEASIATQRRRLKR